MTTLIISLSIIAIIAIFFAARKYFETTKGEPLVKNPFDNTPKAFDNVVRSKFYPDRLYVGKTSKLDPTLRVMFPNALFGFPTESLTVQEFNYFTIDGNEFEEVVFERTGDQQYVMLIDTYEHNIYFLNKVMSQQIQNGDTPPMASQDSIVLEENEKEYTYEDMSGLIEVRVSNKNHSSHGRLIRVYEREVTPEDNEYLICMLDKPTVVDYYIGFHIQMIQLENL